MNKKLNPKYIDSTAYISNLHNAKWEVRSIKLKRIATASQNLVIDNFVNAQNFRVNVPITGARIISSRPTGPGVHRDIT